MIITKTPFRISFFGGGSDIPEFYNKSPGAVLSTSINKYMYVALNDRFESGFRLSYSRVEETEDIKSINHPLVRNILTYFDISKSLDISSIADIPASGTGLGSSSAYCVGLISAISSFLGKNMSIEEIANLACKVEIEMCGDPIGKQDQFASAYGGLNIFRFYPDGVQVEPVQLDPRFLDYLSSSMVCVYTGQTRSAGSVLKQQAANYSIGNTSQLQMKMVDLVEPAAQAISNGDLKTFAQLLNATWLMKKQLATSITNSAIDQLYERGMQLGAMGGKLLGAGAGGFMLFLVPPEKVNEFKSGFNDHRIVNFSPSSNGVEIIHGVKNDRKIFL